MKDLHNRRRVPAIPVGAVQKNHSLEPLDVVVRDGRARLDPVQHECEASRRLPRAGQRLKNVPSEEITPAVAPLDRHIADEVAAADLAGVDSAGGSTCQDRPVEGAGPVVC